MEEIDERLTQLWRRTVRLARRLVETFDLDRKFRTVQLYAQQHPLLTLLLLGAICGLSVPVGAFVLFAAGTIAFTFMGFMFVEGTILAVAGVVLAGILLVFCFFAVTFGGVVFLFFVLLNKLWTMLDRVALRMSHRQPMRRSEASVPESRSRSGTASSQSSHPSEDSSQRYRQQYEDSSQSHHADDSSQRDSQPRNTESETIPINDQPNEGGIEVHQTRADRSSPNPADVKPNLVYRSPESSASTLCASSRLDSDDDQGDIVLVNPLRDDPPSTESGSTCSFDVLEKEDFQSS